MVHTRRLMALLLLALLAACSSAVPKKPDKLVLQPANYQTLPGWGDDDHLQALATFLKSCDHFQLLDDNDATGKDVFLAPVIIWKSLCRKAGAVPQSDETLARQFFETNFVPMRATNNGEAAGLFTGYYEPLLLGSRTQSRPFVYPIYGLPDPGTPSYTRSQIDLGILKSHAPVVAFVDDPVQLFFLHIQGSGRVRLENGQVIHIGYAGANGQPYVAIGKVLADKGLMLKEDITMPALRQWLYDHPADMWQVMWENPSYVFFRELPGDAVGSQLVPLTPGRSLAVDSRYVPLGMPVFIDTMLPETPSSPKTIERKLYVAQDTGGAIRGPVRGDIFFGFGPEAEQLAGRMKSGGVATFLVPRALAAAVLRPEK